MRIRKYDFNYGRRALLQKAALGAGAGVLAPLWPLIASGDMSKA
ncbi:MAG: twin-arginine translocation signal domain-containing protein, partial [Nevskia sp.]|nr:twin-arginine translocation signal domain-containing protein [Nevskia sp.]